MSKYHIIVKSLINRLYYHLHKILISAIGIVFITACEPNLSGFNLKFQPFYGSEIVNCETPFFHQDKKWQLSQLQFFISEIQVKTLNGSWQPVKAEVASDMSQQAFLIGGTCQPSDLWELPVTSATPKDKITALKFTVGVPFSINHLNPLSQPSPLNQPDMFWTWQSGHKFMRLEMESIDSQWIFHLGATGCQSASPVRPPQQFCQNPNQVEVNLNDFDSSKTIAINLQNFFAGINLDTHSSCQSDNNNKLCQMLLPRLGINTKNISQNLFELR